MSQFERNDGAARVLSPQDGQASCAAVDENGRLFTLSNPGDGASEATWAFGSLAFGSVTTASYATLLSSSSDKVAIKISNLLDVAVLISFDGGTTDQDMCPAGQSILWDLAANGRKESGTISVKAIGSNAQSGNIYGTAII